MGQPYLNQQNFRFGDDDNTEPLHSWLAALNTNVNAGPSQTIVDGDYIFLRWTISNTGAKDVAGLTATIEVSYNSGAYATIGAYGTAAFGYTNHPTYLGFGQNTSDRLGGTGTFDTPNAGIIENNSTGNGNTLLPGYRYEILCVIRFDQSQAIANGDTYDFRLTNAGVVFDEYAQTPRITIANLPTATINQTGYRFTSQDGTVTSPTWQAAANTNVTMQRGKTVQLWVELEEASGVAKNAQYELAWQKNGAGGYTTLQGRPWQSAVGSMPAIFGCEADFYANGTVITSNPINQSAKTFSNGLGVESTTESDVHSNSKSLNNQCTVLAFTIRIPSLYGTAVSPGTNNKNDYFDFQLRYSDGTALDTTLTARYTLGDGNGHIGGCPAETQGKLGPFKDTNGNLYYIGERSEVDNHIVAMKSIDNGVNWVYQDMDSGIIDLESVDICQVGDTLHIFVDEGGAVQYIPFYTSDHATLGDTFGTSSTVVATKTENDQGCAVGYRSGTADFVVFYRNGTTSEEIWYVIGTPGSWSSALQLDSTNVNHIGVHVVKGADSDWLHIFYTTEETVPNTIRHRSMNPSDDSLSASEVVYSDAYDGGSGWQWGMTSAISWMSGSNDKVGIVIYDDSDNYPYFVSITDDGSPGTPVQIDNVTIMNDPTWMTSRSPVGELFVDSSGNLYFIMADASTQDLWIYTSDDDGATWSDQTTPVELMDGMTIEMIIGQALTLSGTEYLSYAYADRFGGFDDWVYFDTYTVSTSEILVVDPGSYTYTGTDVTLKVGRKLTVTPGSYTYTGTDIGLIKGYVLPVDPGSYTLTGSAVGLLAGRLLGITPGSYTYTGTDIGLAKGIKMTVAPGSYTYTGTDVGFLRGYVLPVDPGSYTLTGTDIALLRGLIMAIEPGSYTYTGTDITLAKGFLIVVAPGSYTLTGTDVNFSRSYVLPVTPGVYTYTGYDVNLSTDKILPVDPGVYTLTGTDVTLRIGRHLNVDPGVYVYTGYDVTLIGQEKIIAVEPGVYTLTGTDVNLLVGRRLAVAPGSYTYTGTDIGLGKGFKIVVDPGSYALTGTDVSLLKGLQLPIDPGSYVYTGTDAGLLRGLRLPVDPGSYVLTGTDVSLLRGLLLGVDPGSYVYTGTDVTLIYWAGGYTMIVEPGVFTYTGTDVGLLLVPRPWRRRFVVGDTDRVFDVDAEQRIYTIDDLE